MQAYCAGIAPYMAMELCIFDLMQKEVPSFARGFSAALIATTVCYPLDTIRHAPPPPHIKLRLRTMFDALPLMQAVQEKLNFLG